MKIINKTCLMCENHFSVGLSEKHRKFCSAYCYHQYRKGVSRPPFSKSWRKNIGKSHKGQIPWNKGMKFRLGEKHHFWKGDKVGSCALHQWVMSRLGKPGVCEFCGKSGLKGHDIHWANKSGLYKRDLSDWLRLCASCHKKYDLKRLSISHQVKDFLD